MPYKSQAQRRKFHELLKEGKLPKSVVDEFDKESDGKELPERIASKKKQNSKKDKPPPAKVWYAKVIK